MRAEASESAGKHAEALRIVDSLRAQADADARVGFAMGIACARMGLYERAEAAFNSVLVKHPDNFDVLFNLGRAGRASTALRSRTESLEGLFNDRRLHQFLAHWIYRDQTVWDYIERPAHAALGAFVLLLFLALPRDRAWWLVRKYGRRLKGPELVTTAEFNSRHEADGMAFVNEERSVRLCCKNNSVGETEPMVNYVGRLFSSQSEDLPDELNLPQEIPFRQPPHLAFPDHVQNLVLESSARLHRTIENLGWHSPAA